MQAVATRDSAAFRTLYDRYSPLVFGICLRVIRDRQEAEQLLIDVFAELWEHAPRFDASRGSIRTYLSLLARSRSIDHLRRQASSRRAEALQPNAQLHPAVAGEVSSTRPSDGPSLSAERRDVVGIALAALPADQRAAIQLAFFDGLSHQQVAEKLDRPLGTVKAQIRSGMTKLRERLRQYWEGGSRHEMQ